jgi:serine/threonine-protein kinase
VIDVRHQVLHGTPKPLAEMRNEPLPPQLQQIIDKSLQKEPKNRYQQIKTMRDELKQVLQMVSGNTALQGDTFSPSHLEGGNVVKRAWNWLTGKSSSEEATQNTPSVSNTPTYSPDTTLTATGQEKKSVLILPFKNLSKDPTVDFYEFSLADAVITELAQLRSLIVRPSSVTTKYQGTDVDARDAGREQRVHAVLSASFMPSGEKMRVTVQLLDVVSGEILWSDRIDD